jgi:hypothetical protein
VPSTTFIQPSWSLFSAHSPSQQSYNIYIIISFTFINLFHKVHSHHTFTFLSLPQYLASIVIFTDWGKQGVTIPKDLPQVNIDFCLDKRIYHIAPSSLHGLGIFSMDGIKVFDGRINELMEYVGPCYNYRYWMKLVQYTRGMRIYGVAANYIQLIDNDRNKGGSMYIDRRPKASGNIVGFINSTQPGTTNKKPNCIFEGRERNRVFVCAIK